MNYVPDLATIRALPLFADFSNPDLQVLRQSLQHSAFPRNTDVLLAGSSGDFVYILLHGCVKVILEGVSGHDTIIAICATGEVFGDIAAIDGGKHWADVTTLEYSQFLVMESDCFCRHLQTIPQFACNVMRQQAHRLRRFSAYTQVLASLDIPSRLAWQLRLLAHEHGKCLSDGTIEINIRLTQSDLACLTGASRESINKVMTQWKSKGWVTTCSIGYLRLHNQAALQNVMFKTPCCSASGEASGQSANLSTHLVSSGSV